MLTGMTLNRRLLLIAALVVALAGTTIAKTKFRSVWKGPEASGTIFAGKKIAALVIDKDESLRISGEEALVRELTARGMQGVASYTIVPREELQNTDRAQGWYEKAGVEGVVAFRVVSDEKRRTFQPSSWSAPYYGSLWGYYSYSWASVYDPGYVRDDRIVSLETLIFSVPKNALLWAGMSETENPKSGQAVVAEVVKEAAKELKKVGLAR
jgi:hypothetical protein